MKSIYRRRFCLALLLGLFFTATSFFAPPVLAADKGEAAKALASQPAYVKLNPMILPALGMDGVEEVVSLVIVLDVADKTAVDNVTARMPRLNDAYMRTLYGTIDSTLYRNGHFLDIGKVKRSLLLATDGVVGKGVVREVLIEGVSQRTLN